MSAKTDAVRPNSVSNVMELTLTAMCIVLVYVFTAVVNIRLPRLLGRTAFVFADISQTHSYSFFPDRTGFHTPRAFTAVSLPQDWPHQKRQNKIKAVSRGF